VRVPIFSCGFLWDGFTVRLVEVEDAWLCKEASAVRLKLELIVDCMFVGSTRTRSGGV
jgi:hypothetical protein